MTRKTRILAALILMLFALAGCRSARVTSAILYIDQATLPMFEKAVAVLPEGLEFSPNEAEAYFYLGEAHSHIDEGAVNDNDYLEAKKNYSMAYGYYRQAEDLDPEITPRVDESLMYNYVQQINNATNEFNSSYFEAAEGYFRLAYAALPDSTGPIKNIARMKIRQAMQNNNDEALLNEALELIDHVLADNPDAFELLSDKANVLGRLNRPEEANSIYENLLAEHPDDTALLIDIANLSSEEGNFERAADMFVRVATLYENDDDITNDPDIYGLNLQSARFYSRADVKRYEDALVFFEKALRLEDIPQKDTLELKLRTHYEYAQMLKTEKNNETDTTRQAELQQMITEQLTSGVNVGNSLVSQYFDSKYGYYYLAMCQNELGDFENSTRNMEMYQTLESGGQ